ncbi:FCD domain-containing protein [Pseudothauera lacus]|uniref:Phosphonate utilization associated transcriptional regulator n=1 Tax=Pseudothauera lacus TaxID=2136175 RepID=A0A2T4IGL9_9RHOO|nr:FCD domain-containing protein [Pseudothauera lacus]PTD96913.1 phosphonate utilization associated transcriptional regulator [Pseudothauera lacus]
MDTTSPESPIAMLQRLSLPGLVTAELERMILDGSLLPGDKLNEMALAERLGVSRGPLREAFRALEEAGLLRQEKNRGVFVREIGAEEAAEIFDVRASLEALAARQLAATRPPAAIAHLQQLLGELADAHAQADGDRYHALNLKFHDTLVAAAGNRTLSALYRRLVKQIGLFRRLNHRDPAVLGTSLDEHGRILALIIAGDSAAAAVAIERHALDSKARMLARAHASHPA